MKVHFQNSVTSSPKRSLFMPLLNQASRVFGLEDKEICIRLVSPEESQTLNDTFRKKNRPTNVLSFPMNPAESSDPYLGDLALCHAVICEEAVSQNKPLTAHYQHLVLHGLLHLLGYDHETDEEATEMEQLEIELLTELGLPNPYEEVPPPDATRKSVSSQ